MKTRLEINMEVLAEFADIATSEIKQAEWTDEPNRLATDYDEEYLILTDEEAEEMARDYIIDMLWSFNADFLIDHMDAVDSLNTREREVFKKSLEKIQCDLCEGANPIVSALVGDNIDNLIEDAIEADGRGWFIGQYDGSEDELEYDGADYYIYRTE